MVLGLWTTSPSVAAKRPLRIALVSDSAWALEPSMQ